MAHRKRVKQIKGYSLDELKKAAETVFKQDTSLALNYRQLAGKLNIKNGIEREMVKKVLQFLEKDQIVASDGAGKYRLIPESGLVTGVIVFSPTGRAWIQRDGYGKDIPVYKGRTAMALSGDRVEAKYIIRNRKIWLAVSRIIKRNERPLTGTVVRESGRYWLKPDNPKAGIDLFAIDKSAKEGERVVFVLKKWAHSQRYPEAKITNKLGESGSAKAENEAVIFRYGLPLTFPDDVIKLAEKRSVAVNSRDKNRVDFRDVPTFTIDPEQAKDFDDAISVRRLPEGLEIAVHIADVSHYVRPGDAIDREALSRGTSVYLVDRVIPMLPEILSNEYCSLKPGVDRYCFSVVFVFDKNLNICGIQFCKGLINSDKRFSYREAMDVLEQGKGSMLNALSELRLLCDKLRKKRMQQGAFDFSSAEFHFVRNTNGEIVDIRPEQMLETNMMVEEMMLLANKAVAERITEYIKKNNGVFGIYRVHDKPDEEKVRQLAELAGILGYRVNVSTPNGFRKSLNKALRDAAASDQGESRIIGLMAIRSMAKACYSTENIGHYGLGFDFYTHFTSPIRRYPDLVAHRLLEYIITKYKGMQAMKSNDQLPVVCAHCSEMERKAEAAERDSVKVNQLILLKKQVGGVFDGIITGVNQAGLFIELIDFGCDGFLSLKYIDDDYYRFDEATMTMVGNRYGRVFRFGDQVRIVVNAVNPVTRQMDLRLDDPVS